MARHNELGKFGEDIATMYLEKQGYVIRDRNWHKGHLELDIVAAFNQELIIIEVKTRTNTLFGDPEDAVDLKKIKHIVRAANTYIQLFQIDAKVRFDIITIVGDTSNYNIEHIEDAFYSPIF